MKLSVIIPAYNDLTGVMTALNSLRGLASGAVDVEYIVQDDASPDVWLPATVPPEVASVGRNRTNRGFGGNCNAGAERATGDVLLFFNQDAYGVPGWSNGWDVALMAAFDQQERGIVGARLLFPDGRVQSAGGSFDAKGQPTHEYIGWRNPNHPKVADGREVEWVTGAALSIRRYVFEQLGGFDEAAYPRGYFEDVDLCLRVREMGWGVWYAPDATFIHTVGTTGGSPTFRQNARTFHARWVESGKLDRAARLPVVKERFW